MVPDRVTQQKDGFLDGDADKRTAPNVHTPPRRTLKIQVGTLNVDNIMTNTQYAQEMLASCDILCIQEHWLFSFEKPLLHELFSGHKIAIKCFDEDDPIPPSHRPGRGHAGTAIIWNKSVDRYISPLADGSDRLLAIEIRSCDTHERPIVLINTYMPAGNIRAEIQKYGSVLDEVYELYMNYSDSHDVIWLGDLNGAFSRPKPHKRDQLLIEHCKEIGFVRTGDVDTPTYHNIQSGNSFRIDHILQSELSPLRALDVRVISRAATNASPHDPVIADIILTLQDSHRENTRHERQLDCPIRRVPWKHVDLSRYTDLSERYLNDLLSDTTDKTTESLIDGINQALYKASLEAVTKELPKKSRSRRPRRWDPSLNPLISNAKQTHWKWKQAGRPFGPDSPEWHDWKMDKRALRSEQRQLQAKKRKQKHQEIMDASHDNDQSLFYKLIRQHRSIQHQNSRDIEFNGSLLTENEAVFAWAEYFEQLATPTDKPDFDAEYSTLMESMYLDLHKTYSGNDSASRLPTITDTQVAKLVGTLKSNKAADMYGLACEHLKYSHPVLEHLLVRVFNQIITEKSVPTHFKHGVIVPVYKQKKSEKDPDNYRRITITSTVGKVFEKILVSATKPILDKKLNRLQRGFCTSSSSINAAFIISEAIAEAKDCKHPLFTTFLDASKAFDTVYHKSMLVKLHHLGITGDLWQLYCSLYNGMTSQVKWSNQLSPIIVELQGVRQGGVPSTELFKARGDEVLHLLSGSELGYAIGSIDVSAPTCADDITILSESPIHLQSMIDLAFYDSCRERYTFSAEKTKAMVMNNAKRDWSDTPMWKIGERNIDVSTSEVHLGLVRTPDCKAASTVRVNIQKARRAGFSMMRVGVYGRNGLHVHTNLHLFNCFQLPRLLYGLEVLPLLQGDKDDLDLFHRSTLKHLQNLPAGTSTAGVYLILGQLPATVSLARNILTLYVNLIRDSASIEYQIIRRQLAVKSSDSRTFLTTVKALLLLYDLPSAYTLLSSPPTKERWKRSVKKQTSQMTFTHLRQEAARKVSLKFLNINICKPGALHPVWNTVQESPQDILRACTKVRMLTGQYRLQHVVSKQSGGSSVCQLCKQGTEDMPHFLTSCAAFDAERTRLIVCLERFFVGHECTLQTILCTDDLFAQLILDCTMPLLYMPLHLSDHVEVLSRLYCHVIHTRRTILLAMQVESPTQVTVPGPVRGSP
jgi:hypothetical protein